MLHAPAITALPLLSCIVMLGGEAVAQQPMWSRVASVLDMSCAPTAAKLSSPDRHITVDVLCDIRSATDSPYLLRVRAGKKQIAELPIPENTHEIVWSPDSRSFFVDGGQSADTGLFVKAYTIEGETGVREHNVTTLAQRDMVDTFPPCKAANHDPDCSLIETDPEYNMTGLGWTPDSKAIFVFAQVPCRSLYGGIMCQARGYEIEVASGQILQRLSAQQVKQQWQTMAVWNIRIPDPPAYTTSLENSRTGKTQ